MSRLKSNNAFPLTRCGSRSEPDSRCESKAACQGFTLIELLVVVAIIALLISILLPSLAAAREQAKCVRCMTNMRNMMTSATTFAANHRGRFQLVTSDAFGVLDVGRPPVDPDKRLYEYENGNGALLVWPLVLLREQGISNLKKNSIFGQSTEQSARVAAGKGFVRRFEIMSCPSDKVEFASTTYPSACWGYLSYAINEDIVGARTDSSNANQPPVWNNGCKGGGPGGGERLNGQLDKVYQPADVAMFSDGGLDPSEAGSAKQNDASCLMISRLACGPRLEDFEHAWQDQDKKDSPSAGRLPVFRHRKGSLNITYADGHGGFVKRLNNPAYTGKSGIEPEFLYRPRTRVSPYRSGTFPIP